MKILKSLILGALVAFTFSSCSLFEGKAKIETEIDSISYLIGANIGNDLSFKFMQAGLDTLLNTELMLKAIEDVLDSAELAIDPITGQAQLQTFFMKRQDEMIEKRFGHNRIEGEEFLTQNKSRAEVTELASGLQYEVLVEGKGEIPIPGQKVVAHYHGTFMDGTVFDSSVDKEEPYTFSVGGQVMPAWNEIVQLMPVGSKWKIYVPYHLGYGKNGYGRIEPFKLLIFEIELLSIEKEEE